jgi:hypothetical protein
VFDLFWHEFFFTMKFCFEIFNILFHVFGTHWKNRLLCEPTLNRRRRLFQKEILRHLLTPLLYDMPFWVLPKTFLGMLFRWQFTWISQKPLSNLETKKHHVPKSIFKASVDLCDHDMSLGVFFKTFLVWFSRKPFLL